MRVPAVHWYSQAALMEIADGRYIKRMNAQDAFKLIDEATDIAELMLGDRTQANRWMMTPNCVFDDEIPRIMILSGEVDQVLKYLKDQTAKH